MELSGNHLAEIVGTKRQNIYILAGKGKLTKNENGKYESTDPANANYLREHNIHPETLESLGGEVSPKAEKSKQKNPKADPRRLADPDSGGAENKTGGRSRAKKAEENKSPRALRIPKITGGKFEKITGLPEKLMNLTLKEVVSRYGSMYGLKQEADILKSILASHKTDTETQTLRKKLVPREFFEMKVFSYLDLLSNQLFDYPEAAIDVIISEVMADPKEARRKIPEAMLREFEKIIRDAKKNIAKQFEDLKRETEGTEPAG